MMTISGARGAAGLLVLAIMGGLAACSWLDSEDSPSDAPEAGSEAVTPDTTNPSGGSDAFIWTAEDLKARSDTLDLPEQPALVIPPVPRSESGYSQSSPYSLPESTYRR